MAYLLPAGSTPRTKNKWGLGAVPISQMMRMPGVMTNGTVTLPVPRPMPGPMPVAPLPISIRTPILPRPVPPIIVRGPISYPGGLPLPLPVAPPSKIPPDTGSTSGTPVPAGFPTNQFYVAPDGSVWEYSQSGNKWFNTGTPYNVNAPGGGATSSTPTTDTSSTASQPPVSVTVSTPATESGYQSVLDWLTQQTLLTGFPNWVVAGGAALLAWKFMQPNTGRGH